VRRWSASWTESMAIDVSWMVSAARVRVATSGQRSLHVHLPTNKLLPPSVLRPLRRPPFDHSLSSGRENQLNHHLIPAFQTLRQADCCLPRSSAGARKSELEHISRQDNGAAVAPKWDLMADRQEAGSYILRSLIKDVTLGDADATITCVRLWGSSARFS
jgi:hypothetical protein